MKKIIALVLAIMMIASMSVVAFAAGETLAATVDPIEDSKKGDVKIEYNVQKGYIVVIPENMNLDVHDLGSETFGTKGYVFDEDAPATVGAEEQTEANRVAILMAKINKNEKLQVSIVGNKVEGTNCDGQTITNKWMLKEKDTKSDPVGYDIKITGDVTIDKLAQEQVVLEYVSGTALAADGTEGFLHIKTERTSQPGLFQDTLTFTAAIK